MISSLSSWSFLSWPLLLFHCADKWLEYGLGAVVLWSRVSSFPEFAIRTSSLWPNGTMIISTWPRIEVAFQVQQQLLDGQHTQLNLKRSHDFGFSQTMFLLFGCAKIQTYWDFSYCDSVAYDLQLPAPLKKNPPHSSSFSTVLGVTS